MVLFFCYTWGPGHPGSDHANRLISGFFLRAHNLTQRAMSRLFGVKRGARLNQMKSIGLLAVSFEGPKSVLSSILLGYFMVSLLKLVS